MPIDFDAAMQTRGTDAAAAYTRKDAILYALGLGFGRDPLDARELRFVYEKDLSVVPTIATGLAFAANALTERIGMNLALLVHGEQSMIFHRTLPAAADTLVDTHVVDIFDKGPGKGAVVVVESNARIKETNEPLATLTASLFARGDGGFLKSGQMSKGIQGKAHVLPDRAPDYVNELATRPDQALLYRLSGDFNPLHVDPDVAAKAGFQRPILHGLCTYGICCRAILKEVLDYDPTGIAVFNARFSNPVIPGETILTEIWRDGAVISFRARVKERDVVAVGNGLCRLRVSSV
jgi:acyl dehydratase